MLLLLPEASDFRGYYSAAALAGRRAYIAALQGEYHVQAVDTSTWVADDGFADGCHLSPGGAISWTERLGREVLTPWLSAWTASGGSQRCQLR
jgi:hypothetical protein